MKGRLTTNPIPTNNVLSVQVHHALLRIFDVFMKIIVHLRADVLELSESPKSENKPILTKAKSDIQKKLLLEIGEKWDYPDATGKGVSTTTGITGR